MSNVQEKPGNGEAEAVQLSTFTPRVIAVLLIQLLIFLGWTFYWMIQSEYNSLIEERKRALASRTGIAYSIAASLNRDTDSGLITRSKAIARAEEEISRLNFSNQGQGYFYVIDTGGTMLVNPLRPDLVGRNVIDDSDQELREFISGILEESRQHPLGYFQHKWHWSGSSDPLQKIGYYRRFDPWNWIIISDFSPSEINVGIIDYAGDKIIILLVLTVALTVVITITLRRVVLSGVDRLIVASRQLRSGDMGARVAISPTDEMKNLGEAFNQMAEEMQLRNQRVRHAQRAAVFALAKLAEARDNETGGHLLRVREYATVLAAQMRRYPPWNQQISSQFVSDLYDAVMLHDIGKVGIRDSILLKPEVLSLEEKAEMMNHTLIGADTIRAARRQMNAESSFLTMAEEIARNHHERWDGNGYSQGLSREEIPLSARIFAIADVYDALTTRRPYKRAYTHKEAVEMMHDEQGTRFDPQVFDVFLDIAGEFDRIRGEFAD